MRYIGLASTSLHDNQWKPVWQWPDLRCYSIFVFFLIPTEDKRGWAVRPSPTVIDSGIYDLHYFSDGSSNLLSFSSRLLDSFVRHRRRNNMPAKDHTIWFGWQNTTADLQARECTCDLTTAC